MLPLACGGSLPIAHGRWIRMSCYRGRMKARTVNKKDELLSQLEHLVDELDAMQSVVDTLHDDVLSLSPLQHEPSIKELYALIGLYDQNVYLRSIRAILREERPTLVDGDDDELIEGHRWNEEPFAHILDFARQTRIELVSALRSVSSEEWERQARIGERTLTLFEVAYGIIQHDAQILRAAASRLHDSRWSS